ncbi:hypothetical protein [Amycolatopsis kentuckyensis]|uniref:hypothetical protein n=1 Tax=Amycolatopsis kentuckyensis TaxID=218823 RepID=UPI000A38DC8F|nr:hypothetical protein [Amycolatopsis kentuckyensis]
MSTKTGIATGILALLTLGSLFGLALGVAAGSVEWMVIAGATTLALAGATLVSWWTRHYRR